MIEECQKNKVPSEILYSNNAKTFLDIKNEQLPSLHIILGIVHGFKWPCNSVNYVILCSVKLENFGIYDKAIKRVFFQVLVKRFMNIAEFGCEQNIY